jgi:electron transfer flavoprotein beta subunit
MSVHIIVCMKQVPDPEGPQSSFEIDASANRVVPRGLPPVANPYDENALEAAIRIKETTGATITLLCVGKGMSRAVLLKAMATGVDDAILVDGEGLEAQSLDSLTTAKLLAAALEDVDYDLILTGRQASDTNAGQVGLGLAQLLGIPAVSLAQKVEVVDAKVAVESILPDGFVRMEAPLPALVTVSHEVGELRYPALAAIKEAKKIPVKNISPDELGVKTDADKLVELAAIAAPSRERVCRMATGETPAETGQKLAALLQEDGVV